MHSHSPTLETDMTDLPDILLVPVDGSRNANAAATYATRLADKLGVPVRLLFAFPESPLDMFGWPGEGASRKDLEHFSPEGFEKLRNSYSKSAFDAARKAIGETSVSVEEQTIAGEPAKAILDHAGGVKGGMIIMGRRGLSQVKEILMGSTTQRVLHHAECPVLVIQ
jgi:nucleotide-binding universal stress UspA family protein